MHWPGAKITMISGFVILGYIFTPIYFSVKFKYHENKLLKLLDFISAFILITISSGEILQLIESEISHYILLMGLISLTGFFIPILTYVIVKDKNNRFKRLVALGVSVIFLAGSIYFGSKTDLKRHKLDTFSKINNAQNKKTSQNQKESIDYVDLLKNHPEKEKIKKLKYKTDSISNYIQKLKTEISHEYSDNDKFLNAILFEQGKANELKRKIENYKLFIETDYQSHIEKNQVEKTLSTEISNPDISESWEDEYFNHIPKEGIIAILTSFQTNIRYIEKLIIEDMK